MKPKRIFISGKITGEQPGACMHKFESARRHLVYYQHWHGVIINPLDMPGIHFGISHAEAMHLCLQALKHCTHIYMLRDWENSPGAIQEREFAKANDIKIIYQI